MPQIIINPKPKYNIKSILILFGLLCSRLGTSIYTLSLPLIAYNLTGSGIILGTVYALEMLPFIILLPLGGVLIDRFNRRKIMIVADVLRFLFILVIPVTYHFGFLNITVIFIMAFLLSTMSFFVDVSLLTIIPQIIESEHLAKFNARIQTIENLARVGGPVLAGVLIGFVGVYNALYFNGLTYLLMAICILCIGSVALSKENKKIKNIWVEAQEGFLFLIKRSDLRLIALISFLSNFGMGIFLSTYIYYLKNVLLVPTIYIGFVSACGGIFGILGSLLIGPLMNKFSREKLMTYLLLFGGGLGTLLIALIPNWLATGIGFGIWGGSITIMAIILTTYKQQNISNDIFGRVEGALTSLSYLSLPLAGLIGGVLINNFSSVLTYTIAGLTVVLCGFISLFMPLKKVE
ncbi:MFS transporter [Bacillus cereus]|uniref:MFS transporter n=1 Tax=Bacillus cereus TaxID=1396 RepID=UPI000B4B3123|nr:MFS transporter [Bacillus cereus]WJX08339.1 MFS transporter [Bacillus cereus]